METDETELYYLYRFLSYSYSGLKEYDQAVLNCQKAIVKTKDDLKLYDCYIILGDISLERERYGEAGDFYKKSLTHYLDYSKITSYEDIDNGKLKDQKLGSLFSRIGLIFAYQNDRSREIPFMRWAAKLGDEKAIKYCNNTNIKF